jgi:CDP-diacylglycerol---glycerol-3-phosphate 3-phosphatidyltransferase
MSIANLITLARLPLLLVVVGLLMVPSFGGRLAGLGLLGVLFLMDWFDGYVARLRNEVTEIGAVLDIALDRSVENILWITFMYLGLAPLWAPIIFLIRSFVVDGIRGVALARGQSGFGMMHSRWGRFLVASRFMRALYGSAKGVTFGLLYLTWALALKNPHLLITLHPLNQSLIIFTTGLCLIRGLPVIQDGRALFSAPRG